MNQVDVTVYENTVERTYAVPQSVAATVASVFSDKSLSNAPQRDIDIAIKLVTLGKITADDAAHILERTSTIAASAAEYKLLGGENGREWSDKILAGIDRNADRERRADLEKIDFDPEAYYYIGLADSDTPNTIDLLARVPSSTADLAETDVLTATGSWTRLETINFDSRIGVALDTDLLAFVASAFTSGHHSVLLHEDTPLCFLSDVPLLAAIDAADATPSEGSYYAVVDATDTTAVMSLIKISPGPVVYTRNGGAWTLDQSMLDSLLSVSPPPIVELQGETLNSVLEQTDLSQAQQITSDADGNGGEGDKLLDPSSSMLAEKVTSESKSKTLSSSNRGTLTASAKLTRAYTVGLDTIYAAETRDSMLASAYYETDEGYASGFSLSDARSAARAHADKRSLEIRSTCMTSALSLLASLRTAERNLESILMPAVRLAQAQQYETALAASVGDSVDARAQGHVMGAERLRQYWLHGKGAVKIAWGTPNDATRCHQYLKKYLGSQNAWGYCNLLHKRATGVYTGDRRNV